MWQPLPPFACMRVRLPGNKSIEPALSRAAPYTQRLAWGANGRCVGPPQARPAPSGGSAVHAVTSVGGHFLHAIIGGFSKHSFAQAQ